MVGISVTSLTVGRVLVVLYNRHDHAKDHNIVMGLTMVFMRMMRG